MFSLKKYTMDDTEYFESSGSILEDFLEITTGIPFEYRRLSFLLREIDAKCAKDLSLLQKAQEAHLEALSKLKDNDEELAAQVLAHKKRLDTRLEEKSVIVQQFVELANRSHNRVSRDVQNLESILRETGELMEGDYVMNTPSAASYAPPPPVSTSTTVTRRTSNTLEKYQTNALVAACIDDAPGNELWILAKVLETAEGHVVVADIESEEQYTLPARQVVVLVEEEDVPQAKARLGTTKGRNLMALYPDTTSFYAAVLAQAPFRVPQTDPDQNLAGRVCISCIFVDDEDPTTGIAPKRNVPVRTVFLM